MVQLVVVYYTCYLIWIRQVSCSADASLIRNQSCYWEAWVHRHKLVLLPIASPKNSEKNRIQHLCGCALLLVSHQFPTKDMNCFIPRAPRPPTIPRLGSWQQLNPSVLGKNCNLGLHDLKPRGCGLEHANLTGCRCAFQQQERMPSSGFLE